MLTCEIQICLGRANAPSALVYIPFEDLALGQSNYTSISEMVKLGKTGTAQIIGAYSQALVRLQDISCITFMDFAKDNAMREGMESAYPNLKKAPKCP